MRKVEIFRHLDEDIINRLIESMVYECPPLGTEIIRQDDIADALYVIVKGRCGVYQKRHIEHQEQDSSDIKSYDLGLKISNLSDFDVFGESALVGGNSESNSCNEDGNSEQRARRTATVIVEAEPTRLLKLTRDTFNAMVLSGALNGEANGVVGRARSIRLSRMKSNMVIDTGDNAITGIQLGNAYDDSSRDEDLSSNASTNFSFATLKRPHPPPGPPPSDGTA